MPRRPIRAHRFRPSRRALRRPPSGSPRSSFGKSDAFDCGYLDELVDAYTEASLGRAVADVLEPLALEAGWITETRSERRERRRRDDGLT
jgi:hypothetical protein